MMTVWWRQCNKNCLSWSNKLVGLGAWSMTTTQRLFSCLVWRQRNSYFLGWSARKSMVNGRLLNDDKSRQWRLLNDGNATLILLADLANWRVRVTAGQRQCNAYWRQCELIILVGWCGEQEFIGWLCGWWERKFWCPLDGRVGGGRKKLTPCWPVW